MLVMTQDAPTFTDRHELVQSAQRIVWADARQATGAVSICIDEAVGWRQAIAGSGGRMATAAELDQAGL